MIIGADSTDMGRANPFWHFSLALYDQPGVAAACIQLQDECGLDVNMLLFACFATERRRRLSSSDAALLDSAVAEWRDQFVRPIRSLRRQAGEALGQGALKDHLQQAELAAEQLQQDAMWQVGSGFGDECGLEDSQRLLRENLAAVTAVRGIGAERLELFAALVESLLPLALP